MAQTFEQFVVKERERLTRERLDAQAALKAAQDKVDAIEWEFARIEAYEKAPKPGAKPTATRAPSTKASKGKRGQLGGKRKEIYDYIKSHHEGLLSGQVSKHFNPSGDEKLQRSINSALFNLKAHGQVSQSEPRAPYVAVDKAAPAETAEEAQPSDEEAA